MRKLIVLLLALMLCGCSAAPAQDTQPQAEQVQPFDSPATLYDADNPVEKATNDAVRAYPLEDNSYTALFPVADKLMLVSKDGAITLLQGDAGQVVATLQTDLSAAWGVDDLCVGSQNIGYYAADTQEVVILDHMLQQLYRISLPEDMQGKPLIQLGKGEIFYCTTGQIRAIDVETGVTRMVRSHACMSQELLGSYFNDSLLGCRIVDEQGRENVLYLDARTGQKLGEDITQNKLQTYDHWYCAVVSNEDGQQILFGSSEEDRMLLDVPVDGMTAALAANGVVYSAVDAQSLQLSFYDLTSGTRSAEVTIPETETGKITATEDGYVWILSGQMLYRWDTAKSPSDDETVYTSRLYTTDVPDTEGLQLCAEKAAEIGKTYGLTLQIWQDAAQAGTEYAAVAEYQVPVIQQMLTQLDTVLSAFPADFLTITGDVRVNLVQSLENEADRMLHWTDGTCHIFITPENTAQAFLWGLGNAVDTRVLGNSFDYDKWDELNPWWFDYTYDYEENLQRDNPDVYLEGDDRAFTDPVAMSYPTEDRSRLFANAVMENNADMFASSTMQKKLRSICIAIREAYGWEDNTEVFIWEQYLNKPIAPNS